VDRPPADPALAPIPSAALTASRIPEAELARLAFVAVLRKPPDIEAMLALVRAHGERAGEAAG
jgi:CheY-like chemotaxis protein